MNIKFYDKDVEKEVRGQAMGFIRRKALMVEADAKRLCPVDKGRLRASISNIVDDSKLTAIVGTDVSYGPYVELGTYKMAARPFLVPALEMNRGR